MDLPQKQNLEEAGERAREIAILSGFQVMHFDKSGSTVPHAPFSLFPSIIPRQMLFQAKEVQRDFNILMHRVAHDHDFLYQSLKNVIKVDDFTKKLWEIYETVRKEGITQPVSFGLPRNDLMMDTGGTEIENFDNLQLKQVEFNMIASGSAGLMTQLRDLHRCSLTHAGIEFDEEKIPLNNCVHDVARGFVKCWELYGNKEAGVLFVIDKEEMNRMDQVWLEKEIFRVNRYCTVIHRTLTEIGGNGILNESKALIIDNKEIAIVYFRSGYSPTQYKSQQEWEARIKIERSKAIKCPSIPYQLAGTKKIQQELAKKGAVERFLSEPASIERVRQTFARQYSLDKGPAGDQAIKIGIENPHNYVLKPQREGGGNTIFDEEVANFLTENRDSDERSAYIMMDRIFPFVQKNYFVKAGEDIVLCDVANEMGIYGVFIGTENYTIMNEEVGHILRTKQAGSNEGGISLGVSVLDGPYLVSSMNEHYISKELYRQTKYIQGCDISLG